MSLDALLAGITDEIRELHRRVNDLYPGEQGALAYLAVSGLTTGQPLRATSATAAAFGALDLANANAVTGALPHGKGGIGTTGTPSNGQLPIGNGSGFTLAAITGTANRVTVTNGSGTITLSGPQDLHTSASPTFAGLAISVGAATQWALTWNQTSTGSGQLYMPASTNKLHFQAGGNDIVTIDLTNQRMGIKNTSPAVELDVSGTINMTTQLNKSGTKVVGARQTGWTAPTGTAQRGTFATDTVTLINLARAVKALIDDLTTHGLIGT